MNKFVLAIIFSMFSFAALAEHQKRVCNVYEFWTNILINSYGEQLIDARPSYPGGRYEIWKSAETGSWTVLEVMPDNMRACVIGTGIIGRHIPDELMKMPEPQRQAYEKSS